MEKKTSWVCTVITQVSLCFALYVALNLGHPQNFIYGGRTSLDLHFISVKGGFRPLQQQLDLMKQMAKVAKTYRVSFVVSSSELGEDDLLFQNATQQFPSLRLPWYNSCSSRTSKRPEAGCFAEKFKISNGKTLDIIGVDTESLQKEFALRGSLSGNRKNQLHWMIRTLERNASNWRIVVGYQPLVACGENNEKVEKQDVFEYLHRMFMKLEVNLYLSGQDCTSHTQESSIAYIGNPGLTQKEPYSLFVNGNSSLSLELANGFLLHRVRPMQIVTYYINSSGEIAYKTVLQQKGREAM